LLLAICTLLLAPTLAYRMGLDQGSFAYMSAELLEGRWPYIYTWDHQFPGGMLLHALEIALFGKSIFMFRLFDLLVQLANAWFIFRITSRLGGRPAAFVAAAIFCLIYQGYGAWNTAQREGFALLPVLWGFWLYLTADARGRLATYAGIGLGLGLAVTIKPTMLALAGLYVPLVVRLRREHVPALLLATAMLLLPSLLFIAFYWYQDALLEMYRACIGYQTQAYIHINRGDAPLLSYWISKVQRLGSTSLLLMFGFIPFLLQSRMRMPYVMLYLGYLGVLYAIFFQGTFAGYHYIPGIGIGAVMIGIMFSIVTGNILKDRGFSIGQTRLRLDGVLAALLIAAAIPVYMHADSVRALLSLRFLHPPEAGEYRNADVFDFTESWDTAAWLREHTRPDERIQVWGHESLVYYLADRDAASRFQTSNPMVVHQPGKPVSAMQQGWREEFMHSMLSSPPVYIAVVQKDNWWWAPGQQTSWQLLDEFPEFKAFLFDRYAEVHRIGRFVIFRLR